MVLLSWVAQCRLPPPVCASMSSSVTFLVFRISRHHCDQLEQHHTENTLTEPLFDDAATIGFPHEISDIYNPSVELPRLCPLARTHSGNTSADIAQK